MGKRKNEKEFRHDLVCACFVPCFDFFSSVLDNRESETSSGEERERAWRDTDIERERERERGFSWFGTGRVNDIYMRFAY